MLNKTKTKTQLSNSEKKQQAQHLHIQRHDTPKHSQLIWHRQETSQTSPEWSHTESHTHTKLRVFQYDASVVLAPWQSPTSSIGSGRASQKKSKYNW